MHKILKIAHLLSLDVVFGAMICNIMFWRLSYSLQEIPISVVWALGFSVWIIYILDRILDNQKTNQIATERHLFHQKYQHLLWFCIGISFLICSSLLFFLPFKIILLGLITSLITGVYLFTISQISLKNIFQFYKEPITAIVYTVGVFGTTILDNYLPSHLIIGFIFLLISFQNLLLFSLLELKKTPNCHNLASYLGLIKSRLIIKIITCIIIFLSLFSISILSFGYESKVFLIEMLMSIILFFINAYDVFFLINDRYRWVGDSIFLLPLFIIF